MEMIRKIDIHGHVSVRSNHTDRDIQTFPGCDDLMRFYDRLNIEKGIVLPLVSVDEKFSLISNEDCMAASSLHPDRICWFCNLDPRDPMICNDVDLRKRLNDYKSCGAVGLGELITQFYIDDPLLDGLYSACEECGFPVLFHFTTEFGNEYGVVDDLGLPRLENVLRKHSGLKVIGHSQPFWAEISADITEDQREEYPQGKVTKGRLWDLMEKYQNLYCDLSAGSGANAMMRDPENAAEFLETFAERTMYGCDFCGESYDYHLEFDAFLKDMVNSGKLFETTYRKIVRENAIRLFRL